MYVRSRAAFSRTPALGTPFESLPRVANDQKLQRNNAELCWLENKAALGLRCVVDVLIGFPAFDPASTGQRCHRYAVRAKVTAGRKHYELTPRYNKDMEHSDFQERTNRLSPPPSKIRRLTLSKFVTHSRMRFSRSAMYTCVTFGISPRPPPQSGGTSFIQPARKLPRSRLHARRAPCAATFAACAARSFSLPRRRVHCAGTAIYECVEHDRGRMTAALRSTFTCPDSS